LGAGELNRLRVLLNRALPGRGNAVSGAQMVWREMKKKDQIKKIKENGMYLSDDKIKRG
jgi:hypothetical protein